MEIESNQHLDPERIIFKTRDYETVADFIIPFQMDLNQVPKIQNAEEIKWSDYYNKKITKYPLNSKVICDVNPLFSEKSFNYFYATKITLEKLTDFFFIINKYGILEYKKSQKQLEEMEKVENGLFITIFAITMTIFLFFLFFYWIPFYIHSILPVSWNNIIKWIISYFIIFLPILIIDIIILSEEDFSIPYQFHQFPFSQNFLWDIKILDQNIVPEKYFILLFFRYYDKTSWMCKTDIDKFFNLSNNKNLIDYLINKKYGDKLIQIIDFGIKPDFKFILYFLHQEKFDKIPFLLTQNAKPEENCMNLVILYKKFDLIQLFVEYGYKPNTLLINLALKNQKFNFVQFLIEKGAFPNNKSIKKAIKRGKIELVYYFLDKKAKPDDECLAEAIKQNNIELIDLFFKLNIKPNEKCILNSLIINNNDLVNKILEFGIIPDTNCLIEALKTNKLDFVITFLKKGTKPNEECFEYVCKINNEDIMNLILNSNCQFNSNWLKYPIEIENIELIQLLTNKKVQINSEIIDFAIEKKNIEIIKFLLNNGGNANSKNLLNSLLKNDLEITKLLINFGVKPNKECLRTSIKMKNLEIIELIILNDVTVDSELFLQLLKKNQFEIIKLLVEKKNFFINTFYAIKEEVKIDFKWDAPEDINGCWKINEYKTITQLGCLNLIENNSLLYNFLKENGGFLSKTETKDFKEYYESYSKFNPKNIEVKSTFLTYQFH